MIEQIDKRQYHSKTFQNPDGSFTLKAHAGHIHYRGQDGELKDSDFTLEDKGTYWQMVKHNYKLFIAKDFGANDLIRFDNRFRGSNHSIYYEPKMLVWVNNPDMSDMQVFRNQQSVEGYLLQPNVIRYDNAFGDGLHFEITLLRSGFKKEIVIEAKNKLELPPTANHKLVALFRYKGEGLTVKKAQELSAWDNDNYFESDEGYKLEEAEDKKSFIEPAYIQDNTELLPKRQLIKVFWKKHNGYLWQAKVLPKAFLQDAVYPVRADTTTDYYAGSADCTLVGTENSTFSTVRNALTGGGVDTNDMVAGGYVSGGKYNIYRGFLPFNTSDIDAGATITSASLFVYPTAVNDSDNDDQAYINVFQATFANPASPSTADYDQLGETKGSSDHDITGTPTNAYKEFTLNATGIGWINKGGTTQLGLREGHDLENLAYAVGTFTRIRFAHSETTGTDKDPYLKITYTEAVTDTSKFLQLF
jgi:hypothetical protein